MEALASNSEPEEAPDAAESAAAIMQSVRSQHAEEEARPDVSPDGLVYNVTAFELEVERFLEVESWNTEHGIQATDEVQETIVEEMKVAQAAGDDRRSKIQGGFAQSAAQLDGAQESLAALSARLEEAAKGAEAASSAEASGMLPEEAGAPHLALPGTGSAAASASTNPYAEYKVLMSARTEGSMSLAGETDNIPGEATGLEVDNAAVRTRIAKLRAESDLLRKCAKQGSAGRGDFSEFRKALMAKNSKP